ncbi:hypothetical protein HanXRQr2_Chr08g0360571 [Helianthus annuus]|uniref:Uncharacterized protein n=1 Tax=Helianthus annuus TaxID=4232 RepID=A0A9K3IIT6_HELAN|nr:hypothetical protein HanXRQr2_Chr08g0360571 [Helianthus annuus]KAJ0903330.1 hypothetical protein HanPSC8_Chr08g0347861 [Helianthus annuus]
MVPFDGLSFSTLTATIGGSYFESRGKSYLSKSITSGLVDGKNLLASSIPLLNCLIDSLSVNIFWATCVFSISSFVTLTVESYGHNGPGSTKPVCATGENESKV